MATKTVNIALEERLLKQIDKQIKKDFSNRSEYFRRLALSDLRRRAQVKEIFDRANQKGQALGYTSEEEVLAELDR